MSGETTATALDSTQACGGCSQCGSAELSRLGIDTTGCDYVVALAGNPNTGKSTLFNRLTGLRQHVGNWPGKTVVRMEGAFRFGAKSYRVVDLPGTYSLLSQSEDEEVARDFILFAQPDVVVVVLDATCLERNLNLALQVLEISNRTVIAVNLMDEAKRLGIQIDLRQLARELGAPVVGISARKGDGLGELLSLVQEVAIGNESRSGAGTARFAPEVEQAIASIEAELRAAYPQLNNSRWVALRLLEGDATIERRLLDGSLGEIVERTTPPGVALRGAIPLEAKR